MGVAQRPARYTRLTARGDWQGFLPGCVGGVQFSSLLRCDLLFQAQRALVVAFGVKDAGELHDAKRV